MKVSCSLLLFFASLFLPNVTSAQGPNNRLLFVANMNGGQEVPSVSTNARGLVTFLVSDDLASVSVHGVFSGLSGPITGCHIHEGAEGISGPVVVNFGPNIDGNRLQATVALPSALLAKALKKGLYLNVHTAANPAGEIRGQLELMNDLQFAAILNGAEEVPPVATTATGVFRLTYSPGDFTANYIGSYNGLSGPVTASHIHNGAVGVSGPVVLPLVAGLTGTLVGQISLPSVPADFTQKLENNLLYVNVHTAANPGGEIRGQLRSLGPITFETFLNGDQETPPVTTSAIGSAVAGLSATLDTFTYFVSATGLTPTAAHFHIGAAGAAGPVMVPLAATPATNFYTGSVVLNSTQVAQLLAGNVYVNIHTAANPGGEIRGQMESNIRRVYAFDLCGEQEVPSNNSTGIGAAVVTANRLNTHLNYTYIVDGLSGAATAAHIHEASVGQSGPVYLPVNTPNPLIGSGQFQITGNDVVKLESGNTYLNVHTAAFASGEIRGQVRRGLLCSDNVATKAPILSDLKVFPNPSAGPVEIQLNLNEPVEGQLVITDLTGKVLYSRNQTLTEGNQVLRIELGELPAGFYAAQIKSWKHGTIGTFKLTKY